MKNKAFNKLYFVFFNYSKTIIIVILCFVFTSCKGNNNEKRQIVEDSKTVANVEEDKDENLTFFNGKSNEIGNKETAIAYLKSKGIVDPKYPISKVISYDEKQEGQFQYCLLKIEYDNSLGNKYTQDPVINIFFIKEKESLLSHKTLYSIEEGDFSFSFTHKKVPFYKYYDSSTGWIKFITYLKLKDKKTFIETRKLDESEKLDRKSINVAELTYKIKSQGKINNFIEVQ